MAMDWKLDDPADTLKKYYEDVDDYAKKMAARSVLGEQLSARQSELRSQESELDGLRSRLSSMGASYERGDVEGALQDARDAAQRKIDSETRKLEAKQDKLGDKRDLALRENDDWLRNRIAQLSEGYEDADRELTESEKRALEFEIERRQYMAASNERITTYEEAITEEQLSCQTLIGELKGKQDAVYSKFEPDIEKYKKLIDSVNKKFQPDIRTCQNAVSAKVADRDEEIGQLQTEKNREIRLGENEIEGYQKEFKQSEKQFNEQIRMAKVQNKPTTRMENSKVTRLNAINDQIQKINNRVSKKVSAIDQKIEVAQSKHAKQIEKAENQLENVIHNRDQELAGPTRTYNGLVQDRDGQIAALQSKIDQRESECNAKVSQNQSNIEAERKLQSDQHAKIDQQIIEFVMSGDTCLSDVLSEQNAPFIALQARVNTWMQLLSCIKKDQLSSKYQEEHEKQKGILAAKEYDALQAELAEATRYSDQLSLFAKNHGSLTIVGSSLAALGIALLIVLYVVLKMSAGLAGIGATGVGAALVVLTIIKTKKEFSQICKYVSLASDYQEFPCIASHSTKITQDRELARMKAIGDKLYDVHYGRREAQNIHDAKDADIRADYERNLKLIKKEFENVKVQIERARDMEIKRINDNDADGETNFKNEKEDLKNQVDALTMKVEKLNSHIRDLKSEMDMNGHFIDSFDQAYGMFEKQLADAKWLAPMRSTHGKLNDHLYIVPENGDVDEYGHRKIYKVSHYKKAFVVNYDTADAEDGRVEEVNKIIHDLMLDLMYAVYRVNSKETYIQFVVDGMAATNELKSTTIKNAFNIAEIVGKIEDIKGRLKSFSTQKERLAEKGATMDALNESKFLAQDRPETYNILYIIYKPDERKSRLEDDIRMLIPECDKYGFLPIFICEKNTWENGIQEKESIYKDIKGLANNEILIFDGKTYVTAY